MIVLALLLLCAGAAATWLVLMRRPGRQAAQVPNDEGARVDLMLRELCKGSPQMISLHLPPQLPALPLEPKRLESALGLFLELFQRRQARGILVAAGCGALSVEVVLADAGTDIPDVQRIAFLDWNTPVVAARQDLDERLREAHGWLLSVGGSMAVEARLEGGISLRCRFPRGSAKA